jgi:hypothetical protein
MTALDQPAWLSVVIPTHCGEQWLSDALDSLAAQPIRDFECVVVDSSPDSGVRDLVATYADRLRIYFYVRPDLEHWRAKTNFGFEVASAPFVSVLHQDDYWLPTRAGLLRNWLAAAPNAVMHLHPSFIVDGKGRQLGTWRCPLPSNGMPAPNNIILERLLVQNFISVPAPVVRREAFLAVGGLDERLLYAGEWDLYLKLARSGSVVYHAETLSCFRIHTQSLRMPASNGIVHFEQQMRQVLQSHLDAVPMERLSDLLPRALTSIEVNTALAEAHNGDITGVLRAMAAIMRLGPKRAMQYLRDSRLVDRLLPRLRARMAGAL